MATTNRERVDKALEQLNAGLQPFVERELKASCKDKWVDAARPSFPNWQQAGKVVSVNWDTQALLAVMWELWNDCFRKIRKERNPTADAVGSMPYATSWLRTCRKWEQRPWAAVRPSAEVVRREAVRAKKID